jgi:hypothetical protein
MPGRRGLPLANKLSPGFGSTVDFIGRLDDKEYTET